jgi:EmrB/QacA subfamily drug resistance transporter
MISLPNTRHTVHPLVVFAVVSTGTMLATLDQFVVNVALPEIGKSLDSSVAGLSWVLNGYSVVFAALLVPAGRLSDRNGLKRGFLGGVALFTLASAACAAAPNVEILVTARLVQAIGAAFLIPTSLGLLLAAVSVERRPTAVGGMTAVTAGSAALGPVLGGLLVTVDWRLIFLVNVPVGAAAIAGGARVLPVVGRSATPIPDLAGAAAIGLSIAALSLVLVKGNDWGWASLRIVSALVAGVVLAGAFLRRSAKHRAPVIELRLLRVRNFAVASAAATLYSASFAAMLLSVVLWAENAWHWSALRTGLAFAPGPLVMLLLSREGVRLGRRLGSRATAALGCAVFASSAILARIVDTPTPRYLGGMLPVVVLMGFGVLLTLPTLVAAATAPLPWERLATGSAAFSMARQLGFTIGVALFVAVVGRPRSAGEQLDAFRHAWIAVAITATLAAALALALGPQRRQNAAVGEQPGLDLAA